MFGQEQCRVDVHDNVTDRLNLLVSLDTIQIVNVNQLPIPDLVGQEKRD
jgi:hypothetical protein